MLITHLNSDGCITTQSAVYIMDRADDPAFIFLTYRRIFVDLNIHSSHSDRALKTLHIIGPQIRSELYSVIMKLLLEQDCHPIFDSGNMRPSRRSEERDKFGAINRKEVARLDESPVMIQ
ncbi:hypothetical protein A6F59_24490 [Prescottella equi]|nr:hypothetical protein A6F59_24490 [Prescottella equi]